MGIRNLEQLESSIRGSQLQIPQEHLDKIDEHFPLAMDLRWNFGAPKDKSLAVTLGGTEFFNRLDNPRFRCALGFRI